MLNCNENKFGFALFLLLSLCNTSICADTETIEEVTVWGRAFDLIGDADSASQGLVGYADFSTRPLLRVGELVEVVPGMIATQHSGPGKANQYFLRGMNLDHGSDFSGRVDGMQIDMRSHAHASGYLDINIIIPEIVETVAFRKGPYYAEMGDFSAAGGVKFKTYDSLDSGFIEFSASNQEDYRFVGANSVELANGNLLYAGEIQLRDGPWDLEQDLAKINALLKYTGQIGRFRTQLIGMAYDSEWNATNQVPQRAVVNGSIDRFGFIDPDLGGDSSRYSLIAHLGLDDLTLSAYVSYYEMNLINNPTYFLNDPLNGDEFEQEDQRWIYGLTADYDIESLFMGFTTNHHLGMEMRYDDIQEVNLFNTLARTRIASVREDSVEEFSLSLFAESKVELTEKLRATVGLRWDYYDFDVKALLAENSGSDNDSLIQPKVGLAYQFDDELEFYANYGIGFHSNDVRGSVISIDPASGAAVDPVDTLVKAEGAEIGFRSEWIEGLILTLAGFWMELDSELLFVGDAGTSEPNDATQRYGLEFSAFWIVNDWLTLDATYTKTEAEFKGLPNGQNKIPDAHGQTASAGATILIDDGWTASLRLRHFGDAPLLEDGSVKKDDSTLFNLGLSRNFGKFSLGLDVLNLLDSKDDDVAFLFESQLAGEINPVEDIHFHPFEERTFRFTAKYEF
ncbi:MAG: TonB-dependent receptor [Gammaproteobacteria bacterium]|nr:TonB-dependent receptor [Gammaproteobacteria bacterium]